MYVYYQDYSIEEKQSTGREDRYVYHTLETMIDQ